MVGIDLVDHARHVVDGVPDAPVRVAHGKLIADGPHQDCRVVLPLQNELLHLFQVLAHGSLVAVVELTDGLHGHGQVDQHGHAQLACLVQGEAVRGAHGVRAARGKIGDRELAGGIDPVDSALNEVRPAAAVELELAVFTTDLHFDRAPVIHRAGNRGPRAQHAQNQPNEHAPAMRLIHVLFVHALLLCQPS